jgi:flagellar hook-basal body complex protein FliE
MKIEKNIKFQDIIKDIDTQHEAVGLDKKQDKQGFLELLENGVKEVNKNIRHSEESSMDLVSGKTSNIHETMLAATRAELGFNMMLQLRNKVIEAYQEVMRMQV